MDAELKKQLRKIANTVRELSMEAVQKANSGHPGLPMGCAEFGAFLYGVFLCIILKILNGSIAIALFFLQDMVRCLVLLASSSIWI